MRALQNKQLVNWRDGMRLTREHLQHQNLALRDMLRDAQAAQTSPTRYGLLPPADGQPAALELQILTDRPGQVQITVSECSACLPGGQRVEISARLGLPIEGERTQLTAQLDLANFQKLAEAMVILSVAPNEEVAVGLPDGIEMPPRYPYAGPRYTLLLLPAIDATAPIVGPYHMPIARLRLINGSVVQDEAYLPPCTALMAHPQLMAFHAGALQRLGQMEQDVIRCLQSLNELSHEPPRLAAGRAVCQAAQTYLSHNLFEFRTLLPEQAPVRLVGFFSGLARAVRNALESRARSGKEEFLTKVRGWFDDRVQGEIEGQLVRMVNLDYSHTDAARCFQEMKSLLGTLFTLFSKQAQLGLGDGWGPTGPMQPVSPSGGQPYNNPAPVTGGGITYPQPATQTLSDDPWG